MEDNSITVGNMFWGKSESYPWWPCVVIKTAKGEFTRTKKKFGLQYHVQFIGPEYDVCWITQEFLIKYEGSKKFEVIIEEKHKVSTPNSKQIYSMQMSPDIRELWQDACKSAEDMFLKSTEEKIKLLPKNTSLSSLYKDKVAPVKNRNKSYKRPREIIDSSDASDCASIVNKRDRENKDVPKVTPVSEMDTEEICLKSFINQETFKLLEDPSVKLSREMIEDIIKSHWDVLDTSTKELYLNDNQEIVIQQSKVSGRRIKVPCRLRSVQNLKDSAKSETKKNSISPEKKLITETAVVRNSKKSKISSPTKSPSVTKQPLMIPINSMYKETLDISLLRKIKFSQCLTEMMKIIITDINCLPENACFSCFKPIEPNAKYVKCHGQCEAKYHYHCAVTKKLFHNEDIYKTYHQCIYCFKQEAICCICKNSKYMKKQCLIKCEKPSCSIQFHPNCLKYLYFIENSIDESDINVCPIHSCLTCFREDTKHLCNNIGPFIKCIKCPSTFHCNNICIPAGSCVLTKEKMICQRHNETTSTPNRTSEDKIKKCFICFNDNATLKCCRCIAVFHPNCIGMPTYTDLLKDYACPSCKLEKPLFHGEIAWIDYQNSWNPVEIVSPDHVPREYLSYERQYVYVQIIDTEIYLPIDRCDIVPFKIGLSIFQGVINPLSYVIKLANAMYLCYINWRKRLFPYSNKFKIIGQTDLLNVSVFKSSEVMYEINKKKTYTKITVNCYKENTKATLPFIHDGRCACSIVSKSCYDSYCRNFSSNYECNALNCSLQNCTNRKFTHSFFVTPVVTNVDVISGYGVKITGAAAKGRLIGELMGQVITTKDVLIMMNNRSYMESMSYIFQLSVDSYINCENFGNEWRHINHSCRPNCQLMSWNVGGRLRLGVFTTRDVSKEELTIDYRSNKLVLKFSFLCQCGNNICPTIIGPSPLFHNQHQFIVPRCCMSNNQILRVSSNRKQQFPFICNLANNNSTINVSNETKINTNNLKLIPLKSTNVSNTVVDSRGSQNIICFRCNGHGELLTCNKGNCDKRYHLQCLEINTAPLKLWYCPMHFCHECGKAAIIFCSFCPTSHCGLHSQQQKSHSCKTYSLPNNKCENAINNSTKSEIIDLAISPNGIDRKSPPSTSQNINSTIGKVKSLKENVYEGCDLVKVPSPEIQMNLRIRRRETTSSICRVPTKKLKVQKHNNGDQIVKKLSEIKFVAKDAIKPNYTTTNEQNRILIDECIPTSELENLIISPVIID